MKRVFRPVLKFILKLLLANLLKVCLRCLGLCILRIIDTLASLFLGNYLLYIAMELWRTVLGSDPKKHRLISSFLALTKEKFQK